MRRKVNSNSSVAAASRHATKVSSHTTVRAIPFPHAGIPHRKSISTNSSMRPLLFKALLVLFFVGVVLLSSTAIKLSIDAGVRSREEMKEQLAIEKNFAQELLATQQYLISEERIRSIAITELGMEYNPAITPIIKVDFSKLKEVEELVNKNGGLQ